MKFVKHTLVLALVAGIVLSSCKKSKDSDPDPDPNPNPPTTQPTAAELSMDSVFYYCKEAYLWNDLIPSYESFNPRQYKQSTIYKSDSAVLSRIRKLQPLDRFSFITSLAESDGLQTGQDVDLGFFIKAAYVDQAYPLDSAYWFVTYVYNQSSAGTAGVKRGWIINKINGTTIKYDNPSINILNNVFFGSTASASFEFLKPDGSTSTSTLSKTSFQANAVLYKGVIPTNTGKAGYLVFNQFFGQPARNELATAFTEFQSQGINDLIVDLRYNPGGSTETQDTLSNFIAPTAANNQKMYTYVFSNTMQTGQNPYIKAYFGIPNTPTGNQTFTQANNTVNYAKAGGLNLSRVFFIVSGSTASASELTINNLRPYMNVKLIGDTTYGKPVGFFPIEVGNAAIYPISFKTVNSAGAAEYYTGFAPDKVEFDGIDSDWGDVTEPCLADALKFINTGAFKSTGRLDQSRIAAQQGELKSVQRSLERKQFSGMFSEKRRMKL